MPDTATLSGLISGLGGASIGALTAVYGPALLQRIKNRQDAEALQLQRRQGQGDESLSALAVARVEARAWLTFVESTLQDVAVGTRPSASEYDASMNPALRAVSDAVYTLARPGMPMAAVPNSAPPDAVVDELHNVARTLRQLILTPPHESAMDGELWDLDDRALRAYMQLKGFLVVQVKEIGGFNVAIDIV